MATIFELLCETPDVEDILIEQLGDEFTADDVSFELMSSLIEDYGIDLKKEAFRLYYTGVYSAGNELDKWHEAYKKACEGCPYITVTASSVDTHYSIIYTEDEWMRIDDDAYKFFHAEEE